MPALTRLAFVVSVTMSTVKASTLAQLQRSRTIVRLERAALEEGHVTGRIVGSSAKLVAVAVVSDAIRPDGFNVFRRADISKLTVPDPYADFVTKALLRDIAGNVFEWCHDWWTTGVSDEIDPAGPETGTSRVLRGAAYGTAADYSRSARRYGFEPAMRQLNFGVRPVRSLP